MSERNRDKIKKIEHELGRYQKKVGELMKANAKLHEDIKGLDQLRMRSMLGPSRSRLPTVRQ